MGNKVPPNGGWGWIIVLSHAVNCLATIPITQGFGLVFKDMFPILNLSAASGSTIMNVNFAFGMVLGLVHGPLLRTYGCRKVCIVSGLLFSLGVFLTGFATSFVHLLVTYGMLSSLGMGLVLSSSSLALNAYFTTKRGRAMGLAMTITGLGPIFVPQITSFLMSYYGIQGTVLVYAAYSLHVLVGAALLQPVKWHMKDAPDSPEIPDENQTILPGNGSTPQDEDEETNKNNQVLSVDANKNERKRRVTISTTDYDTAGNCESPAIMYPSPTDILGEVSSTPYRWWSSGRSIDSINLGSSMKIFDDEVPYASFPVSNFKHGIKRTMSHSTTLEDYSLLQKKVNDPEENTGNEIIFDKKRKSTIYRAFRRVVVFYDLDLLRDPIYVNIMLGMSIAIFAELNFSLLTPFILSDMHLSTRQIATVMSITATADLLFRGFAPFIGEWLKQPPRTMYLISLVLLVISRTSILFVNSFLSMICVSLGLGVAKGIRSVFMTLVISSYVPIERLAYASGIQSVVNGIIMTSAGPFLGLIRDYTGSYSYCIILINCVTTLTITMWVVEMFMRRRADLRTQKQEEQSSELKTDTEKC